MNKTELRIIAMDYAVTLCSPGQAYTMDEKGERVEVNQLAEQIVNFLSADEPKEE